MYGAASSGGVSVKSKHQGRISGKNLSETISKILLAKKVSKMIIILQITDICTCTSIKYLKLLYRIDAWI